MDEAGDAFVVFQAQIAGDRRVVGHPCSQPLCAEAVRLRRLQQRKTYAAGGEQLLLHGDVMFRAQRGDHDDHDRRVAEASTFLGNGGGRCQRVGGQGAFGEEIA